MRSEAEIRERLRQIDEADKTRHPMSASATVDVGVREALLWVLGEGDDGR